jgi:hypothetical protein
MNELSMPVTYTVTNGSDQILRIIRYGWAWLGTSNTHPSECLFCIFFFWLSFPFFWWILHISWKRIKEAVQTRFI